LFLLLVLLLERKMSSLRNAAKRVTHKERGQPAARRRLGFLEKHKDYVVRARDFQKKKKFLTKLRTKGENRNPDEFYFNMHKSKVVDGKHRMEDDETIDAEDILLMKSQVRILKSRPQCRHKGLGLW
jgi:U3 small nucleolar RNA-associated protein 11